MTTTPETVRLSQTVDLEIYPRSDQSPQQAQAAFRDCFRQYLTSKDGSFWEDFGARPEDIRAAQQDGENIVWGGYDGPYVTGVHVTNTAPASSVHTRLAELEDHLCSAAGLLGGDGGHPEYVRALGEHAYTVMGISTDCGEAFTELADALGASAQGTFAARDFVQSLSTAVDYLVDADSAQEPEHVAATLLPQDSVIFARNACTAGGISPDHADAANDVLFHILAGF